MAITKSTDLPTLPSLSSLPNPSLPAILLGFVALVLTCIFGNALYNITLHPLARFPGPKHYGAFSIPYFYQALSNNAIFKMKELHDKYGDTVRYGPNALSFTKSVGWTDINGRRVGGKNLIRDPVMFRQPPGHHPSILLGTNDDHTKARKALSHAFTENALRAQESIIRKYCEELTVRLLEEARTDPDAKINMTLWLNSAIFDILGDLSFGESFHTLIYGKYHPWMITIQSTMQLTSWFMVMNAYPGLSQAFFAVMNLIPAVGRTMKSHNAFNEKRVKARLDLATDRKDFLGHILEHNEKIGLTEDELISNASDMILAGSQAGVFITGMIFLLLTHPDKMELLVAEILGAFKDRSEMSFASEAKLPYLGACIQEALRMYTPAPAAIPNIVPAAGITVDGVDIPGGVGVSVHPYATFMSESNFRDPEKYVPERWLGDPAYESDDRMSCQPFGYGPRGCIGKKLAHAEARSVMIRLLYHFDIELCEESKDWIKHKGFFVWRAPDLMVRLKERV